MSSDGDHDRADRSPTDHHGRREQLGAYVLGALDHGERLEVEQHLETCSACRDEVSRLSSLPSLLDRLSLEEVSTDHLQPSARLRQDVAERIHRERRRDRTTLRIWQGAAAVLVGVALALWAPWQQPPPVDAVLAPAQPVAAPVEGQAELMAWEWGTTVRLEVTGLPEREAYVLWAVAVDGRRQQAGTWGPTADQSARVIGASAILRNALARVEVTDADGEVLAVFEPNRS